ncbi:MAG: ATP-binding cassette domain-containing protein [Pseudomonadota bacterium]
MIVLRKLTFARAGEALVSNASLQIGPGWKVGLTGANGCGKSSFFALFQENEKNRSALLSATPSLHAESGDLDWPASWTIAHVAQDTPALPDPALAFVLDGDAELRQIERALVAAEAANDGEAIGTLHARLGDIEGYSAQARAAELLHGLGFTNSDFAKPVAAFSGGWRVRLNLARALMCRSDLLLLDEPTNHLDLDAVLWLEAWLRSYRGTLLMISHDRDFLDAVVGQILHIEQNGMKLYTGTYSAFERQRAAQLALQQSMFEKQQREVAHLHSFIDRFRAKATKARQAQSRMKALERMEDVAAAHVDTPFTFRFRDAPDAPDPLLTVRDAQAGYGEHILLEEIDLTLRPGERIALLGRNGAGKSTLIKLLAGSLAPLSGTRHVGKGLQIGYFAQHQLEQLRPDESPLQHMQRLDPKTRAQDLRDYLGSFDFRGEMSTQACGRFSGGEKSRLALALLIWTKPNLLLLDEPTNHLDLEMREALTLALQEYEGGVILVSHDRHLLRTTADQLLLVADGRISPFSGDLDDYAQWLGQQRDKSNNTTNNAEKTSASKKNAAQDAAHSGVKNVAKDAQTRVRAQSTLRKDIERLETQLANWQKEKQEIDTQLSAPDLYTRNSAQDNATRASLYQRQQTLSEQIEKAEERWLNCQAALEI